MLIDVQLNLPTILDGLRAMTAVTANRRCNQGPTWRIKSIVFA